MLEKRNGVRWGEMGERGRGVEVYGIGIGVGVGVGCRCFEVFGVRFVQELFWDGDIEIGFVHFAVGLFWL